MNVEYVWKTKYTYKNKYSYKNKSTEPLFKMKYCISMANWWKDVISILYENNHISVIFSNLAVLNKRSQLTGVTGV